MNDILAKVATGTFVVVAIYLVVTNPNGDSAAGNAISNGYSSGVKALQGR